MLRKVQDILNDNVDQQLNQRELRSWYVGDTTSSDVPTAEENEQQLYIQALLKHSKFSHKNSYEWSMIASKTNTEATLDSVCG